jgi:hypothetical protein
MLPTINQEVLEEKLVKQYNNVRTAEEKVGIERTAKSWFEDVPKLLQDFQKRTNTNLLT